MSSIKLKEICIQNFRSFVGSHTISFLENGICMIRGKNKDTNGESGAGKSSIVIAIAYLFKFGPYSATELQTWLTDEPMSVSGLLETDKGEVWLNRGINGFSLKFQGKEFTGKLAEKELNSITNTSPEIRAALTYRGQNQPALFLNLKNSDKKAFLSQVLDLGWAEKVLEQTCEKIDKLESDLLYLKKDYDNKKLLFERLSEPILPVMTLPDVFEINKSTIERETYLLIEANNKIKKDFEINKNENTLKNLQNQLDLIQFTVLSEKAKEDESRKKIEGRKVEFLTLKHLLSSYEQERLPRYRIELINLEKEFIKMTGNICPTCNQDWSDVQEHLIGCKNRQIEISKEIETAEFECKKISSRIKELELMGLAPYNSSALSVAQKDKEDTIKLIAEEQHRLKNSYITEEYIKNQELINENKLSIEKYNSHIKSLNMENQQKVQIYNSEKKYFIGCQEQFNFSILAKEDKEKELNIELDIVDLIKGFLNKIFDEILCEVSIESNKILETLPNVSNVSIMFQSDKVTAKGDIKQEIIPVVEFNGKRHSLESGASGGMLTSIGLAVDLSLSKIISARSNVNFNWIILDESFNGHDKITKESCLEVLKQYAEEKLVIIIDHESETKEFINKIIEVKLENGASSISN